MSQEVEQAAREMGWKPKEEFRGDPDKWTDASTFVSRGENFIPILRADREKLRGENAEIRAALSETKTLLLASQEAIAEMQRYHAEDTARQVEKARKDLVKQLKVAREDGDVDAEVQIQDELTRIRTAQAVPPPKPAAAPAASPAAPAAPADPDFVAWSAKNSWFATSARLRGLTLGIAEELRGKEPNLAGPAFYQRIDEEMADYIDPPSRGTDKVAGGGRPSSGSGTSNSRQKTYADLPADARAACDSYASKLVGPGRAHKDVASWQAAYVRDFFAGE
jgi:hypothetical protein